MEPFLVRTPEFRTLLLTRHFQVSQTPRVCVCVCVCVGLSDMSMNSY